jgi:hypothetical protein
MEGKQGDTQLFLLRLWIEELPQAGYEGDLHNEASLVSTTSPTSFIWSGKLQHVVRGEAHVFTGWDMLISCLEAMLIRDLQGSSGGVEATKAMAKPTENEQAREAEAAHDEDFSERAGT